MFVGTCPGLYTPNELFLISNQLLPGGKRGARRVENQDIAQERYFRRVRSHLHVVVCLKYRKLDLSNSLEKNQLYKFPKLVTRSCCVDIYRAWPHEALVSIAQKQLEEEESVFSILPLKRREKDAQSAAVCSIMAHVHLSSRCMARRIYGIEALKFYSPDTFLDFIDLFRKISRRICLKEKVSMIYIMNGWLQWTSVIDAYFFRHQHSRYIMNDDGLQWTSVIDAYFFLHQQPPIGN